MQTAAVSFRFEAREEALIGCSLRRIVGRIAVSGSVAAERAHAIVGRVIATTPHVHHVREHHHLDEGIVENAAVPLVVSCTVVIGHAVGHVVFDYIPGLLDGEKLLVVFLIAGLFLVVDVAGHDKLVVFACGVNGDDILSLVNLIDSFFKRCHPGLEIAAFRLEKCFLNLVQVDLAGLNLNLRLIRDVMLDIRSGAARDRQSDAEDAKDAEATFHLDTPKLVQLHYNNVPRAKRLKVPAGGAFSALVLHNKLAIVAASKPCHLSLHVRLTETGSCLHYDA